MLALCCTRLNRNMKSITLLAISLIIAQFLIAQSDSICSKKPELNVGGFIDVFNAYDPANLAQQKC